MQLPTPQQEPQPWRREVLVGDFLLMARSFELQSGEGFTSELQVMRMKGIGTGTLNRFCFDGVSESQELAVERAIRAGHRMVRESDPRLP